MYCMSEFKSGKPMPIFKCIIKYKKLKFRRNINIRKKYNENTTTNSVVYQKCTKKDYKTN